MIQKALYVRDGYAEYRNTFSGYTQYINLEGVYRGASARNKVVLRCNLAEDIVLNEYLSAEKIHYAGFVCSVFMGLCFAPIQGLDEIAQEFSRYLKLLVAQDQVFCRKLENLYQFTYLLAEPPISMFSAINQDFRDCFRRSVQRFNKSVNATTGITPMYYDGPVVYYSINDSSNNVVTHDKNFKQEVLSNAKNWNGTIKII